MAPLLDAHLRGTNPLYRSEHRVRHHDGHWVWVLEGDKVVERDSNGQPIPAAGTHSDISSRQATEEALRKGVAESERLAVELRGKRCPSSRPWSQLLELPLPVDAFDSRSQRQQVVDDM